MWEIGEVLAENPFARWSIAGRWFRIRMMVRLRGVARLRGVGRVGGLEQPVEADGVESFEIFLEAFLIPRVLWNVFLKS